MSNENLLREPVGHSGQHTYQMAPTSPDRPLPVGVVRLPCRECGGSGVIERRCCEREDMVRIDHPLNAVDFGDLGGSRQAVAGRAIKPTAAVTATPCGAAGISGSTAPAAITAGLSWMKPTR